MSKNWLTSLDVNPVEPLLGCHDDVLTYFVQRDLLGEAVDSIETRWILPEVIQLVDKQDSDGGWKYPGKNYNHETGTNYKLLETYRNLRILVEMYGFNKEHPALGKSAEFILSHQTGEGDIRGILGNQYMPYYHGGFLELLIKAGYNDAPRVIKGLEWLLSVRQDDGGWVIPAQLIPAKQKTNDFWLGEPFPTDTSRPHAHLATGMVLRAFAAHPEYRQRSKVTAAGICLKTRLFKADKYNDRRAPQYWLKFQYPFWWTNLLTALDTLYWLGFSLNDDDISKGLDWFLSNQVEDGLWETGYGSGQKADRVRCWVGLAVCRVLKRYCDGEHPSWSAG